MKQYLYQILVVLCCLFCFTQNTFSQSKNEKYKNVTQHQVGFDFGLGANSFYGENDSYTKVAIDLGVFYENNEKFIIGLDFSLSPKESHEDTGKDGSRSTFVNWDGGAICVEMQVGYKLFSRTSILVGMGNCFVTEFEVMKGYSNLTSYKRGTQKLFSPLVGIIYEFPNAYFNNWYLKYDMAIGDYDRFSLSAGLKF